MADDPRLAPVLQVLHRELWPESLLARQPPGLASDCRRRAREIAVEVLAALDAAAGA